MISDPTSDQSSQDLAKAALQAGTQSPKLSASTTPALPDKDEVAASNEVAETLTYLQNIIERNANELMKIKNEIRDKRESLSSVFENDASLSEAEEQAKQYALEMKARKSQVASSPQATALKTTLADLNQEKKEIEETLSNHLLNYYSLTNSKSFDTSDGDQWEFNITAKVKSRPQGQE